MSESDKSGKPEHGPDQIICPSCGALAEAEHVHNGLGLVQVEPFHCFECQWFEGGKIDELLHERSAAQARIAELEKMLEQFTYYGLIHTVNGVVPVDYDSHEDLIKKAKLIFQKQP